LPKTVTRQRRGCDLNPVPSVPESSTLTTRLPSHTAKTTSSPKVMAAYRRVSDSPHPQADCDYFPPGPQLPSQPLRGLWPISLLGEQKHDGREQFARQCRGCDKNPGPSAPESSTLTTRLPSHPRPRKGQGTNGRHPRHTGSQRLSILGLLMTRQQQQQACVRR